MRGTWAWVLALVACVGSNASADQTCKPVVGHFEANVAPVDCTSPVGLCTAGRVWGGIQGTYHFVMSSAQPNCEPDVPAILFFTGRSDVALKSGDHVFGVDTGAIDLSPAEGGFASLITFRGGTGAASGATGQIRLRGDYNPVEGTTSGDYLGTICTP